MELQDIVRRLRMGQSIKAIKRETGKHRRVIRRLLLLAEQEGWLDEQHEVPSEQQLQEVYHEQRSGEELLVQAPARARERRAQSERRRYRLLRAQAQGVRRVAERQCRGGAANRAGDQAITIPRFRPKSIIIEGRTQLTTSNQHRDDA